MIIILIIVCPEQGAENDVVLLEDDTSDEIETLLAFMYHGSAFRMLQCLWQLNRANKCLSFQLWI